MRTVTTKAVCLVASVSHNTLKMWIQAGVVTPIRLGKKGRGATHLFSFMQTVGLAVGVRLRNGRRGASPLYIGDVAKGFSLITKESLQALFSAGRTHFSESFDLKGRALLDLKETGERYGRVDVKEVYEAIQKEMSVAK